MTIYQRWSWPKRVLKELPILGGYLRYIMRSKEKHGAFLINDLRLFPRASGMLIHWSRLRGLWVRDCNDLLLDLVPKVFSLLHFTEGRKEGSLNWVRVRLSLPGNKAFCLNPALFLNFVKKSRPLETMCRPCWLMSNAFSYLFLRRSLLSA